MRGIDPRGLAHDHPPMRFGLPAGRCDRRRRRDERYLLEALLDAVGVAAIAFAADGRLAHANRRARELLGSRCRAGTDPDTWIDALRPRTPSGLPLQREYLPPLRALLQDEAVFGVDVLVSVPGGELLLSTVARPVRDEHGGRRGAILLLIDVTEQRRREALGERAADAPP